MVKKTDVVQEVGSKSPAEDKASKPSRFEKFFDLGKDKRFIVKVNGVELIFSRRVYWTPNVTGKAQSTEINIEINGRVIAIAPSSKNPIWLYGGLLRDTGSKSSAPTMDAIEL